MHHCGGMLFPDAEQEISDEDLEWIIRLALEARRRVKEQQKRVFKAEFRNTHFMNARDVSLRVSSGAMANSVLLGSSDSWKPAATQMARQAMPKSSPPG